MKNLFDKLTNNTKEELELYLVEYPTSAGELIEALKIHKFFVAMRWGDVEDLCFRCRVNSPYKLLKE
jgi:hypothetical protein